MASGKTQTIDNMSDPVWEKVMVTPELDWSHMAIALEVWDSNGKGDNRKTDKFLGRFVPCAAGAAPASKQHFRIRM